jgi:hypothetical protein
MLVLDLFPLMIWGVLFGGKASSFAMLFLWVLLAVMWWALVGLVAGLLLTVLGPLGKMILSPIQETVAGVFRLCGLRGLANFCATQ